MAIYSSKASQFWIFVLVPKSPIHTGLIYVKNPGPNISCLGPFKYQVYLYGSEAIKYLNAILYFEWLQRQHNVSLD
jgi:hypothetical protein